MTLTREQRDDLATLRQSLPTIVVGPGTAELWAASGRIERALAAIPGDGLDVERLGRAIDQHNEKEEPFAAVHCNTGDDCHKRIAQDYREIAATEQGEPTHE